MNVYKYHYLISKIEVRNSHSGAIAFFKSARNEPSINKNGSLMSGKSVMYLCFTDVLTGEAVQSFWGESRFSSPSPLHPDQGLKTGSDGSLGSQ